MPIKVELPAGTVEYAPLLIFGTAMLAYAHFSGTGTPPPPPPNQAQVVVAVQDTVGGTPTDVISISIGTYNPVTHPAAGTYVFTAVNFGTYPITIVLPSGFQSYAPTSVIVNQVSQGLSISISPTTVQTFTLTATVTDQTTSTAIAGASCSFDGGAGISTNSSGVAVIPNIVSGTSGNLVTTASGYNTDTIPLTITSNDSQLVLLSRQANQFGNLIETVQDSVSHVSLAGVLCVLDTGQRLRTSASGIATFGNVPFGSHNMTMQLANYQSQTKAINVNASTVNDTTLLVRNAVQVATVAVNVSVINTHVNVQGATITLDTTTGTTDSSGIALFTGVPIGSHTVSCSPPSGYAVPSPQTVTVTAPTTLVQFVVTPIVQTAQVSLLVQNSTTRALVNVPSITLGGISPTTHPSIGVYVWTGVPEATHAIVLTLPVAYSSYSPTSIDVTGTVTVPVLLVPVVIQNNVTVSVFSSATGSQLRGATVTLGSSSLVTPASGQVVFTNVPSGTYSSSCALTGYTPQTKSVNVTGSVTVSYDMVPVVVAQPLIVSPSGAATLTSQPLNVNNTTAATVDYVVGITPIGTGNLILSTTVFAVAAHAGQSIVAHIQLPIGTTAGTVGLYSTSGAAQLISNVVTITW